LFGVDGGVGDGTATSDSKGLACHAALDVE
jgi:hypothetical protein